MMHRHTALKRLAIVAASAALTVALAVPAPALGMTGGRVTLNAQTGGKSVRFTLTAMTEAPVEQLDLEFPKGFDLSSSNAVVDTLKGLKVTHVQVLSELQGARIRISLKEPLNSQETLRVLLYKVRIPYEGGDYQLVVRYRENGQEHADSLPFTYATPKWWERVNGILDKSPAVAKWNSVRALGVFLRPQYITEAISLGFFGWLTSLNLVALAFPLAIIGGLLLAFMKMAKRIAPARWLASAYINVIRGTPLFLQIYIAFIGTRIAGFRMNDYFSGVFVLMLNSSAYLAEIFRAGIQSIHKGQFEASMSLGMSYSQTMVHVIIPQTVKRVLPTMTSEFILLFKDTALLFAVGVFELMMYSNQIVARSGNLTPFVVAAAYYLVVTIPLIHLVGRLEEKLAVSERGDSSIKPKHRGGLFWRPVTAGPISELEVSAAEHESR